MHDPPRRHRHRRQPRHRPRHRRGARRRRLRHRSPPTSRERRATSCSAGVDATTAALPTSASTSPISAPTRRGRNRIERFGPIDCLVNNAGIGSPVRGDLLDLKPENFDRVLDVNLRGTVFLTQAVARPCWPRRRRSALDHHHHLGQRRDGLARARRLLHLQGRARHVGEEPGAAARADGIGVFEVRPGIIRTDMTAASADKYDGLIADGLVPSRRWGEPRMSAPRSPRLPPARSASPPARSSMSTARCRCRAL